MRQTRQVEYSSAEAAAALGVNAQRVRQLLAAGNLPGRLVGGRWVIDGRDVADRLATRRLIGRPFSPRIAWAALLVLSGERPEWVDSSELARLRRSLARLRVDELVARVRNRATVHQLHAHPAAFPRLTEDRALLRTGPSARGLSLGLTARGSGTFYVHASALRKVARAHGLVASGEPNVTLRAVEGPWPFASDRRDAPVAAVMVDLLEEPDERSQRAGRTLYHRIVESASPVPLLA